jgi:hypothetical protein
MPTYGFTKIAKDKLVGKPFTHELDADGKSDADTIRIKDIARTYARDQKMDPNELVLVKLWGADDHRIPSRSPRWPLI